MTHKSKWDTLDWREWLDTQSEDAVITELKWQYDKLSQQTELLRRAKEIIEEVGLVFAYDGRGDCCFCSKHHGHDVDCEKLKAQALLPELEKALEVGK